VFEMFVQVGAAGGGAQGGLGIGLPLVKKLVELHGGSVEADSAGLHQGSTFRMRLPLLTGNGASPYTKPSASGQSPTGARRVLIVDDNRDAADALAQLLRLEGHDAEVAYGGMQALQSAHRQRPDLVLLDLGMPGMDGFEVARRLRAELGDEPRLRIVALTGWGQDADRQRTAAASFDGHLLKPPSAAELQAVLSDAGSH
jgi:CheY-like chemotaxis protein